MCSRCGSFDWAWVDASGGGNVASWTVSHRSFQPERAAPYVVLLVRLVEGAELLLPGGWAGASDGSDLEVGLLVQADFLDLPEDPQAGPAALLNWRPKSVA
jgi:uncharacterized protein